MLRQIYIINATQVVASDSNPQGVYSTYRATRSPATAATTKRLPRIPTATQSLR